ncbi:hypothetical protein MYCTH_2301645 [Thermothelomyces thermophilus ATCC 42464]|uniref:Uncharacterized protein n=1 Tax=Thermothelomyces thermophilus (strain ATCC 42464 / BCRC 31852 / DSM 1799) TaxID=573729 RepID=G2Q9U6_THET4|nr:uncharacterized protein MYCTH_2301645 [Thermothelomyces thermophilus ATCC 42464]AEO56555.1 hypothetical protein MYCTH_2301645 [Thermothelomyces thermophilus ATCC 42464]
MSPEKAKTEIQNPRRILAVSLADSAQHLSDVIRDLTGTRPSPAPQAPEDDGGGGGDGGDNNGSSSSSSSSSQDPKAETNEDTIAGTTHPLPLSTPYYTASVPIWLDLVASPAEWSAAFLSPEAKEVLDVLGGVLVVFALPPARAAPLPSSSSSSSSSPPPPPPSTTTSSSPFSSQETARERARELITHVGKVVREGLGGWEWDGVGLAVGVGPSARGGGGALGQEEDDDGGGGELDEWEDLCAESGLEFVHVARAGAQPGNGKGAGEEDKRNEFGERVGMARVLEALKANDWSGAGTGNGGDLGEQDDETRTKGKGDQEDEDFDEFDPEKLDFGFDKEDFVGLREAILSGGRGGEGAGPGGDAGDNEDIGEEDVQQLERLMLKLQAVRDASAGLPEEHRKRMAARAVGEVMREL